MPQNKTKTLLIISLIINIILFSGFFFIHKYVQNKVVETANKEQEVKNEIAKKDALSEMSEDIAQGQKYQEELLKYLIEQNGIVDFFKALEELASTTDVKTEVRSVEKEASSEDFDRMGLEKVKINIQMNGSWNNIQLYLKLFENYPLKLDIKSVSMKKFSSYEINKKMVPQWDAGVSFTVMKVKGSDREYMN